LNKPALSRKIIHWGLEKKNISESGRFSCINNLWQARLAERICTGGSKMAFFDDLVGKVVGAVKGSPGQEQGLVEGVMGLLTNQETGGIAGLIQSFNQQGLGDIISSWVGTGTNAAITPEQVQEVLGSDVIQQLAEKSGVSFDAAQAQLAALLPSLIDKATPEGKVPEGGLLDMGQELLRGLFSQK
jgi:uncharacterized protein YidB (DUF937 family)